MIFVTIFFGGVIKYGNWKIGFVIVKIKISLIEMSNALMFMCKIFEKLL